jgi:integrase
LAYEATLRQKLVRGGSIEHEDNESRRSQTFGSFAQEWFKQYVVTNNKFSEQYAKQKILKASLVPFFGEIRLDEINVVHIERYKSLMVAKRISPKTINNRLTVLSKCLRCAHDWLGSPMPTIKLLRCPPPKTDYLTTAECDMLLTSTNGQLQEMVLLALRTGMRQGEIRGLQWSSIDWQNRSITVRHTRYDRKRILVSPKSNRERHIPIDTDVYEMLFRRKHLTGYVFTNPRRNGEPFTSHRVEEDLGVICRDARLRHITWHVLRHTFATQLTLRGVPLTVVKELLGHSAIATTMRYSHVAPSALRSAIELLNPINATATDFGHPVGNQWRQVFASKTASEEANPK